MEGIIQGWTYINEKDYKNSKEFFCICGSEYKHKPPIPTINDFGPCDLMKLDKALKLDNFYCEIHNIPICCVCSIQCHNKCELKKSKYIIQTFKTRRKLDKCMCRNERHTQYNEHALTFPLDEYQILSGIHIWPIQILNILFNNKRTFHRMSTLFQTILGKEEYTEKDQKKFLSLLKLFSNTFNRKFKTFYYQEDILETLSYEKIVDYISNIQLKNKNDFMLKFRSIFIFLFIHLRKDFQNVKCITSIDFLCSSPLERIKYKTILGKQTIYNENIYNKYNKDNKLIMDENNILKNMALKDICQFMEISMKSINFENHAYEFEVGLKYLCFILKKMLFTKDELIMLSHYLKNFFKNFCDYIDKNKADINKLLNIFQGIAEIIFMVVVSYNDLTLMDYFNYYEKETLIEKIKPIDDFIHVNSDHGSALFQIIIKSSYFLKKHYDQLPKRGNKINESKHLEIQIDKETKIHLPENGGLFPEKIVTLFTETLGIFSLADSSYFEHISAITKENLLDYYRFMNKFKNDSYYYFNAFQKSELEKQLFLLKSNIEERFNFLFTSSNTGITLEINKTLYQDIFNFSQTINNIMATFPKENNINQKSEEVELNLRRIETNHTMLNKESTSNENNIKNELKENINNIKKNINKTKYLKKLSMKNIYYKFLKGMENNPTLNEFVDILIISNFDENISKILSFLSNRKYPNLLTPELCNIIYSTLSLFFFSKNGMEYFLMGKNLSRINKIINRFNYKSNNKNINPELGKTIESNIEIMRRTIDFLFDISKGIKIYGLSIKHHKVLSRFKKNLLEHISVFNKVSSNNLVEFSIQFKKIIKIAMNLKEDFKYEDFEELKNKCILIFKTNPLGLFNKDSFFQILYLLQSNQNLNIISSNDKNNFNKKAFISLYFEFFKLVTINTFYFYNNEETNEILKIFLDFNDLERIKSAFLNDIFTLKQKYILLEYLRTIYFSDYLDEYEILKQQNPLTNSQFEILLKNKAINANINPNDLNGTNNNNKKPNQEENDNISNNILINKYKKILELEIIMDIYSNEIKKFPKQLINCDLKYCEYFHKRILLDIKYISIFFYSQKNNFFGKLKILFYGLALDFMIKIDSFKQVYQQIQKSYRTKKTKLFLRENTEDEIIDNNNNNNDDWENELEKIKVKINDMQSISFNICDKKKIYCYLTESLDSLIKKCEINPEYNLQNYLEFYDVMAESNFTPFSLIETWDYEYFYEEKEEELNEHIKEDHYLYKIEMLKKSFVETFIDINNTNFLQVFTNAFRDDNMFDFREKYIDYFISFFNSNEGNNLRKLKIQLCILTKMMFYDSENMQAKFSDINHPDIFFYNLNLDINKFSVLVFSLSKNIFANEMAAEITNLNKLYMQFIQALGEGFNLRFHDNIFHSNKINIINNDNINIINNNNKSEFEEEKNDSEELFYEEKNNLNENNNFIIKTEIKKTIYESIMNNLNYAIYELDLENIMDSELPYDKLIIFVSNAIDFIIEYISSTEENDGKIKHYFLKLFLDHKIKPITESRQYNSMTEEILIKKSPYLKLFFSKIPKNKLNNDSFAIQRKKVICYTKIKLIQMLIYYLLTGGKKKIVSKLENQGFTAINLFSEILYNFNDLINHLGVKNPNLISQLNSIKDVKSYTNKLIEFYTFEEDFRNMIELQLIFDIFILIKTMEESYRFNHLSILFEKNEEVSEDNTFNSNGEFNLSSKFSKSVYKFLNIIILKVEIKTDKEEKEEDKNKEIIAKKVKSELKKDRIFSYLINVHKNNIRNINDEFPEKKIDQENNIDNMEVEESSQTDSDDSLDEEDSKEESNKKTIFFPRPFLTFFLSKSTQDRFIATVDRSSSTSKYISLHNYADYCLFEMIVNKHLIKGSRFNNFWVNLNYTYVEMINYLFIAIQNIFILFRFYKKTDDPYEEYYTFDKTKTKKMYHENMVLALIQILLLLIFLFFWYRFKFLNSCQYNIMKEDNSPFVGKRKGKDEKIPQKVVDYFQGKEVSNYKFFSEVNKGMSNWKKLYVIVVATHITNREIIALFISLILNICYLVTKMSIFFVVQILLILNIVSTLFDLLLAIQLKWKNIILLLLFDFLCLYIFMWLAFFYFPYFFVFDEVMIPKSKETLTEGYCFSSVQCYLFMLSRGSLSNGGISNDLGLMSYKSDVSHYIGRFFFDLFFFLLISLYIGKMFLSLIIDNFGELREKNHENNNDKKNICFICQIERDESIQKNIDFDKHVENVHNLWNYVYFLNYLYVNNSLNFNWIENSVWENIKDQNLNWLPSKK